jgi:hypothetical protein
MPDLWQEQGLPEKVWDLQDLLQGDGVKRGNSRGSEIQLVRQVARMVRVEEQNT